MTEHRLMKFYFRMPQPVLLFEMFSLYAKSFIKINNYEKVTMVFNHTKTLFISYVKIPVFDKELRE